MNKTFSPVPLRALNDTRLTASHWRAMTIVCFRDQMGKNGKGCYAHQSALAQQASIHYTNFGKLAKELEDWKYFSTRPDSKDGRRKIFHVVYDQEFLELVGEPTNNPDQLFKTSWWIDQYVVGVHTNYPPKVVGVPNCQPVEEKGQSPPIKETSIKETEEKHIDEPNPDSSVLDGEVLVARQRSGVKAPLPAKQRDFPEAVVLWNQLAEDCGLPTVQNFTPQRKANLAKHLKNFEGIDGWRSMLAIIRRSPHLLGDNERGWRATFDWVFIEKNYTKIMERNYERSSESRPGNQTARDKLRTAVANA